MTDLHEYFEQENDNPISLLIRRMRIPVMAGMAAGLVIQLRKGRFDTPATFGSIAYATLPICSASFLFLGTVHVMKRIREKDDTINYLIGVLSATPLMRNFMPFTHTCAYVFAINFFLIMAFGGYQPLKNYPNVGERIEYGTWKSGHNIYKWARNSLGGPYVAREGSITIPSK